MRGSPDSAAAMPNSCCDQSIYATPWPGGGWIKPAPDTRAKNESGVARLIPSGACAERRQQTSVSTVAADGEVGQPQLRQRVAQLAQRGDFRMRPRRLAESIIAEIEPAAGETRPGNARPAEPLREPLGLEGAAFEDAIGRVDLGDQALLNAFPVHPQPGQRSGIDRYAISFDPRRRRHVSAAQQGARPVDRRQHPRQQPRQRVNVLLAIVEDHLRSASDHGPPRSTKSRICCFSAVPMPSRPKRQAPRAGRRRCR